MADARTPESFGYECQRYGIDTDSDGTKYFTFILHTYQNWYQDDEDLPEYERLPYEFQSPKSSGYDDPWWVVPLVDFLEDNRKIAYGEFVRDMVAFTHSGDGYWSTDLEYGDEADVANAWIDCDESNHLPISALTPETPDGTYWCGEFE